MFVQIILLVFTGSICKAGYGGGGYHHNPHGYVHQAPHWPSEDWSEKRQLQTAYGVSGLPQFEQTTPVFPWPFHQGDMRQFLPNPEQYVNHQYQQYTNQPQQYPYHQSQYVHQPQKYADHQYRQYTNQRQQYVYQREQYQNNHQQYTNHQHRQYQNWQNQNKHQQYENQPQQNVNQPQNNENQPQRIKEMEENENLPEEYENQHHQNVNQPQENENQLQGINKMEKNENQPQQNVKKPQQNENQPQKNINQRQDNINVNIGPNYVPVLRRTENQRQENENQPKKNENQPQQNINQPEENQNQPEENENQPKQNVNQPQENENQPQQNVNRSQQNETQRQQNVNQPQENKNGPQQTVNQPQEIKEKVENQNQPEANENKPHQNVNQLEQSASPPEPSTVSPPAPKFGAIPFPQESDYTDDERLSEKICYATYFPEGSVTISVAGGKIATAGGFTYMAAIGYSNPNGGYDYQCGGALISAYFILTAAHCRLSGGHRPACLSTKEVINQNTASAIGYGQTGFGLKTSTDLMTVDLQLYSTQVCQQYYTPRFSIERGLIDSQLCAGDFNKVRDTCPGDSGGPLLERTEIRNKEVPYILGVTSFGPGCAEGAPGVYTKVFPYLDWIESIVWPEILFKLPGNN